MTPFIILEIANNHMGNVQHGKDLISAFSKVTKKFPFFEFAVKFQYRQLDTFIHPAMQGRDDIKFIKRFSETKLKEHEFNDLIVHSKSHGFSVIATPFDEDSVAQIEKQNLDCIKIASCSFGDWPLLERVSQSNKPVIASTAGAPLDLIDSVVAFFLNRGVELTIMHCVGEYPTEDEKMNVNQIEFLKNRYPEVKIGFSTHESPNNFDIVKLAVAKGAKIFEKHVGLPTEKFQNNAYSANPEQFDKWLESINWSISTLGVGKKRTNENLEETRQLLGLRRGVFVKRHVNPGDTLTNEDVYFAFPPFEGQLTTVDWSKYKTHTLLTSLKPDDAVLLKNTETYDSRTLLLDATRSVSKLISESGVPIPKECELELSHHYGIDKFYEFGLAMVTVVNRNYCKKILICLPNQKHPEQLHRKKEETFHVLFGNIIIEIDGEAKQYSEGDVIHIYPKQKHSFFSPEGCVVEEISSTHFTDDSFYTDETIQKNKHRKSFITHWRGA